MNVTGLMKEVNAEILAERVRQNQKWGHQRHSYETWYVIASEEGGEVAQAIQVAKGWGKDSDAQNLYKEIVQHAAVLQAFGEQVLEEMEKKKDFHGFKRIQGTDINHEY